MGDIWQQIVEHGESCGFSLIGRAFSSKEMLMSPDSGGMAAVDPGYAIYVKKSMYVNMDLSWVDRLDSMQIILSLGSLWLNPIITLLGVGTCVSPGESTIESNEGSLICAWCLEESPQSHVVPKKSTCEVFLRRKRALQDMRMVWLWWVRVAHMWLSKDVAGYGGRLLVRLVRA